jgi:hypothetical protein
MFHPRRLSAAATAGILAATLIAQPRAASDQPDQTTTYSQALADLNVALAANGHANLRIDQAEISVTADGWQGATTLIANDRTHRLSSQFVERDPRRGGFADIAYLVDQSDGGALGFAIPPATGIVALPNAVTEARIDASMLRWQNSPHCPGPAVTKVPDTGSNPDVVDDIVLGGALGTPMADITHGGWLDPPFFNAIAPGGASFILGVTFTFIFTDGAGNPTDIDNNGRADVAFREIYYNRGFGWSETPARPGIDLESVITHEAGHAFGLGHFGKVFLDNKGTLKFAPRAVMNAVYVSRFAELAGTDNASFCSIWANRR